MASEPAISTYGERNAQAPGQLDLFSFLVGKWNGTGKVRLPNSFLRRQVNPRSGSVSTDDGIITVISEDAQMRVREHYHVTDRDHFTYGTDASHDGGRNWDPVSIEMAMTRAN